MGSRLMRGASGALELHNSRNCASISMLALLLTACGPGGSATRWGDGTRIEDRPGVDAPAQGVGSVRAWRAHDSETTIADLGDGRAEMIVSVFSERYRADDGSWQPISNELVHRADGDWENRTHTLRSVLPAFATGRTAVDHADAGSLTFDRRGMGWCDSRGVCKRGARPSAASAATDARRPGRLAYPKVYPGVDEEFRVLGAGLKHDIVLTVPPMPPPGNGAEGFITFAWELRVSEGLTPVVDGLPVRQAVSTQEAISFHDASGAPRMAIAAPRIVASSDDDPHTAEETLGSYRIALTADHYRIELSAPLAWLLEPDRSYPVRLDPTVVLQPGAVGHTGTVSFDEVASYDRQVGRSVSGTLAATNPSWRDVEGYARFSTTAITGCMPVIDDVDLLVWLANHDNNGVTALPLHMDIHGVDVDPEVATDQQLYDSILGGSIYASELIPRTGPPFDIGSYCLDGFVYREYELGPTAATNLQALLPDEWFAVGFRSEIGDETEFDHIDYIGYDEEVSGACGFEPFPNSRISLRVTGTLKGEPIADAGGPYSAECAGAATPVALDGSGSVVDDGSPVAFNWTTDCPGGTFDDANLESPVLTLPRAGACLTECKAILTVTDGCGTSTATSAVTIRDILSPAVASGPLDGSCLWPPNHKYVCTTDLAVLAQAADECSKVTLTVDRCSSDQPDDAKDPDFPGDNGDGHTFDDCAIAPDAGSFCVRSERLGTDQAGRQYGVTILADDGCSEVTPFAASFYVPHDRSSPRDDCLDPKTSPFLQVHDELPWAATP